MPACSAPRRRRRPAIRAGPRPLGETRADLGRGRGAGRSRSHRRAAAGQWQARRVPLHDLGRQGARAGGGDGVDRAAKLGRTLMNSRKIRAGSEFIRRISGMFIFSIRTVILAVAMPALSLCSAAALSVQSELLCSPEGLMRLIPQFNVNGQFTIPNPNTDLQTFLSAQQGLSNAIDMILAQENISQNSSDVGSLPSRPLIFASNWLASEVGIQTDGTNLSYPEAGGKFGGGE